MRLNWGLERSDKELMGRFQLFLFVILWSSCSNNNFSGKGGKSSNVSVAKKCQKSPTENCESKNGPGTTPVSSNDDNDPTKCWVAIDGGYFGCSTSCEGISFPRTLSGESIKTGQKFSTNTGGVFLNAQEQPFVFQQGQREIDVAIDRSLDSIAIAPGMSVEIRNRKGEVKFQKNGPYVAITPETFLPAEFHARRLANLMPDWFRQFLEQHNYNVPQELPRQGFIPSDEVVGWIKVSRVPGTSCDLPRPLRD
jgi:hypothetical protein